MNLIGVKKEIYYHPNNFEKLLYIKLSLITIYRQKLDRKEIYGSLTIIEIHQRYEIRKGES